MSKAVYLSVGTAGQNPGRAAYGVVLTYPAADRRRELSGGFELTIQNRVTMIAIATGLEELKIPCRVLVYCPTVWVVNTIARSTMARNAAAQWRRVDGTFVDKHDLWQRLYSAMAQHEVTVEWRARKPTSRDVEPEIAHELARAAELAKQAMHVPDLPPDPGYQGRD